MTRVQFRVPPELTRWLSASGAGRVGGGKKLTSSPRSAHTNGTGNFYNCRPRLLLRMAPSHIDWNIQTQSSCGNTDRNWLRIRRACSVGGGGFGDSRNGVRIAGKQLVGMTVPEKWTRKADYRAWVSLNRVEVSAYYYARWFKQELGLWSSALCNLAFNRCTM